MARTAGHPHIRPVLAVWLDGRVYSTTSPKAVKARNLEAWPDVSTRFLLRSLDRFFPAEFQRRVVRERIGLVADEIESDT